MNFHTLYGIVAVTNELTTVRTSTVVADHVVSMKRSSSLRDWVPPRRLLACP